MGIDIQTIDDPESSGVDMIVVYSDDKNNKLTDIEVIEVDLDA
ncbi:hypothetical protein [Shimazuella kribbensis]|nr:hypothetical protein [Shimazuella kribbensis]